MVRYILTKADTSYKVLIECRTFNQLGVVVSTPHMVMKFSGKNGSIITMKVNFSYYFYILVMQDEHSHHKSTLILGKPFLMTTKTK